MRNNVSGALQCLQDGLKRRQDIAAVRALLESYHRIDEQHTGAGLWIEAASAREWMKVASGDDIAASRAAVFERGRAQVQ